MFHELAPYYDRFTAEKDYRGEAARLIALVRRHGRSGGREWLDVACGTGRHLAVLRRSYSVHGIDASPPMLRIARRRLPGVPLARGDMRTFRTRERFDVVTCLFSAIGHLTNERDLFATFANFARHLKPGGVALVEPWLDPASFRPGYHFLLTYRGPDAMLARLSYSRRRGARSIVESRYLIGVPGRGIREVVGSDVGLLVSHDRLVAMMAEAGLSSRFLARGLRSGRGLLLGRKPRGGAIATRAGWKRRARR
jgi:ubiquinone/menaquinone biosynthesis C-methylase UbiE